MIHLTSVVGLSSWALLFVQRSCVCCCHCCHYIHLQCHRQRNHERIVLNHLQVWWRMNQLKRKMKCTLLFQNENEQIYIKRKIKLNKRTTVWEFRFCSFSFSMRCTFRRWWDCVIVFSLISFIWLLCRLWWSDSAIVHRLWWSDFATILLLIRYGLLL